jgi:hypothetical protein
MVGENHQPRSTFQSKCYLDSNVHAPSGEKRSEVSDRCTQGAKSGVRLELIDLVRIEDPGFDGFHGCPDDPRPNCEEGVGGV